MNKEAPTADDNLPDRELMTKLIEAFDTMTAQENSFLAVLKNIVEIHEQATSDLAEENDELRKIQETSNGKQNDVNTNDTQESKQKGEDDDDDEKLIKETLKELEQVSIQALAAAELNEKLVETLQRHKKNMARLPRVRSVCEFQDQISDKRIINSFCMDSMMRVSMLELRKDKTEKLKMAANAAIVEVKKAKKEVSINRAELQKKQREAEDLRKAALKAGIQIGAEEQKHSDEVTAALNAQVNNVDRIPPIPVIEKSPEDSKDAKEEDPLEARRKQIRENVRKEKERVHVRKKDTKAHKKKLQHEFKSCRDIVVVTTCIARFPFLSDQLLNSIETLILIYLSDSATNSSNMAVSIEDSFCEQYCTLGHCSTPCVPFGFRVLPYNSFCEQYCTLGHCSTPCVPFGFRVLPYISVVFNVDLKKVDK
ncbi:hypothetical protein DICVIV_05757 [Dictyocaulus viviparus]|uniref:Uncharacterized protein n=1 Tax=Dictyocaulus viviparus TaxID=29172 RepID=A0A0D8XU36_DICVI|nr:hypothetical protein DICVIV_05757 [Dictyocaulus viviparus]